MLYFDHSATTPPYPEVIQAVHEVMERYYGNPSSIHRFGVDAERLLIKSREIIAKLLQTSPDEIVITSGGTESNNLAVIGTALQYSGRGKHLITTAIEHPSVYECFQYLRQIGYEVTYIMPDSSGKVSPEAVLGAVRDDTILVSVMHVNNEIGTIQPIADIGRVLRRYPRILFHVDAVQSIGKIPVQIAEWGIDLLSASAHKFRGPKGTGFLYRRKGIQLRPILFGGGQEGGLRSGTENVPGVVGLTKALRMTMERREEAAAVMYELRKRLLSQLIAIPDIVYNGSDEQSDMAPHIVSVSVPGIKSEIVVHALEESGFIVSTKSACSSGEDKPSRILLSIGGDQGRASSGIRISLSPDHTMEQIDRLAGALQTTIESLRRYR